MTFRPPITRGLALSNYFNFLYNQVKNNTIGETLICDFEKPYFLLPWQNKSVGHDEHQLTFLFLLVDDAECTTRRL